MTQNRFMIFREGDEGGGGGGEGGGESRGTAVFGGDEGQGQGQQQTQAQQPPAGFDAAAFSKTFADTMKPLLENQQQPQQKPLTAEELKKALKVWDPDDDWFKRFGNIETQKAAVLEMRDGMMAQYDTLGQFRLQDFRGELDERINPALEYVSKAEVRDRDNNLAEKYPLLGKKEMKPMVSAIFDSFKQQKRTFESEDQMFDAVKDAVEAVGKQTNPDFKIDAGSTPADDKTKGQQPPGGLRTQTPGSGGGGGGGGNNKPAKPRGVAVFD